MNKNTTKKYLLPILLISLMLGACSSTTPSVNEQSVSSTLPVFGQDLIYGADYYLSQAAKANTRDKAQWELFAAQAYYQQGALQAGDAIIAKLSTQTLNTEAQASLQLITAEAALIRNQAEQALSALNFESTWLLSNNYWDRYYQLRAQANKTLQRNYESLEALIERDAYLSGGAQQSNLEAIWQGLRNFDAFTLRSFQQPGSWLKNGWLELAAMSRERASSPDALIQNLQNWQADYPQHPATSIVQSDIDKALSLRPYAPKKIAVLLPLSGRYGASGQAIRDGLSAAYFDQGRNSEIRYFDSSEQAMDVLYQELESEGFDFIIGPLLKPKVIEFAAINPQIPWLALNEVESTANTDHYFFALAPEDEARQSAKLMHEKALIPLILAPRSALGQRMVNAFNQQWQQTNQANADVVFYENRQALQGAVSNLLHTNKSAQRISQVRGVLKRELETEVRSRRDAEAIYLVGDNADIRLIKPFIDVTVNPYAKAPQLYASSRSYSKGNFLNELNGLISTELPWMSDNSSSNALRYHQLWANAGEQHKRLYALGFDAFNLLSQLMQMRQYRDYQYSGLTGALQVDEQGKVLRQLVWLQYRDGELVQLTEEEEDTP